jgi:hypothetical protein
MKRIWIVAAAALLLLVPVGAVKELTAIEPEIPWYSCDRSHECVTLDPGGTLAIGQHTCIEVHEPAGDRCYISGDFCLVGTLPPISLDGTRLAPGPIDSRDADIFSCEGEVLAHAASHDNAVPEEILL